MLVLVKATDAFVTILPSGDMVSAIRNETVSVPKAVADKLVAGGLATLVSPPKAPEDKTAGPAPENKTAAKPAAKARQPRAKQQPPKG